MQTRFMHSIAVLLSSYIASVVFYFFIFYLPVTLREVTNIQKQKAETNEFRVILKFIVKTTTNLFICFPTYVQLMIARSALCYFIYRLRQFHFIFHYTLHTSSLNMKKKQKHLFFSLHSFHQCFFFSPNN